MLRGAISQDKFFFNNEIDVLRGFVLGRVTQSISPVENICEQNNETLRFRIGGHYFD